MNERLIAAACRLFGMRGYGGTSVQAVADAVGIRKASLLYHYPSKPALRDAVMDHILGRWKDTLPQILLAATTGGDRLESALGHVMDFFEASPDRAQFLLRESIERPEAMSEHLRAVLLPWISMAAGFIRQGIRDGTVYEDIDPETYILQLIHLIVGGAATGRSMGILAEESRTGSGRMRQEVLRLARAGLFKDASPHG